MPQDTKKITDEDDFQRNLELARLGVEQQRLQVEQARLAEEKTRSYLERWRLDVVDRRDKQMGVSRSATEVASLSFRTIFLLNGGAMVAIPTFGKLVNKFEPGTLALSLKWFGAGLCCSAFAMMVAYIALSTRGESWRQAAEGAAMELMEIDASKPEDKTIYSNKKSEAETLRVRYDGIASVSGMIAFAFAAAGVVAFLVGARLALDMLGG